jgi:hypothetical protein
MNVGDRRGNDKQDQPEQNVASEASPETLPTAPRRDEAGAQTHVDLLSRYAHPRGTKFDLRQFLARHPVPVALSCLALVGGTIAAVVGRRRRRDTWHAKMDRLRRLFADAANGAS